MQFSLGRALLLTAFINLILAAVFVFPPWWSFIFFTVTTVFLIPPFVVVGVVQTRGRQQAFFLGAMVAGTPHFVYSAYLLSMIPMGFLDPIVDVDDFWLFKLTHFAAICLGAIGGLAGLGAHVFYSVNSNTAAQKTTDESKERSQDATDHQQN